MKGNISTILQAHQMVREKLEQFFDKPDKFEFELFLQFLFYRSFSLFQCEPSLASDFWYQVNGEIVDRCGESDFNKFGNLREKRFKEYDPLYDALIMTDLMWNGKPSKHETESKIIAMWGLTVFPNIENDNPLEMDKIIQFPSVCNLAHTIHMAGISGIFDFENDEIKDW